MGRRSSLRATTSSVRRGAPGCTRSATPGPTPPGCSASVQAASQTSSPTRSTDTHGWRLAIPILGCSHRQMTPVSSPASRSRSKGASRARPSSRLAERDFLTAFRFWPRAEDAPLTRVDLHVVDACLTPAHEPVLVELPELVAIAAPPLAAAVMAFVLKSHGNAVAVEAPEVLAQRVVQLDLPLLRQKGDDRLPSRKEEVAVAPDGIDGVGLRDPFWISGVPRIFRGLHLLRCALAREGR